MSWEIICKLNIVNLIELIVLIGFIFYVIGIFRIIYIEHCIKKLEQEILYEKNKVNGDTINFVEGNKKEIDKKYKPNIEKLKRDRQFILDKMPFLKK